MLERTLTDDWRVCNFTGDFTSTVDRGGKVRDRYASLGVLIGEFPTASG